MKSLKIVVAMLFVVSALVFAATLPNSVKGFNDIQEAPTTDLNIYTDDLFNGFGAKGAPIDECEGEPVPNRSFEDNKFIFNELESTEDGLGPTYNAPGCGDCHQNPESGGISQIRELRAGHLSGGVFVNPPGGQSLIQLRAIAAPMQERLDEAPRENIRAFRTTLNTIGDGFVECIANNTLVAIRNNQPPGFQGTIIQVPVVEANNELRVARFGWKNQHASLISFSGDAYLNEMGITNPFDGNGGKVIPISLRYASPENEIKLACWFFHPKRATRSSLLASTTGTWMIVPWKPGGWLFRMATSVLLAMHSTKPSPMVLRVVRKALMFSRGASSRRSCIGAAMARSWISDCPPGGLTNTPPDRWPALSSRIWLMPPLSGFWWQSPQPGAL